MTTHGQHQRHYFGLADRVEFESYEKLESQFEAQRIGCGRLIVINRHLEYRKSAAIVGSGLIGRAVQ